MKGELVDALMELIEKKAGREKSLIILEKSNLEDSYFTTLDNKTIFEDISDDKFYKLIKICCEELFWTKSRFFDEFAFYWTNEYAPQHYRELYSNIDSAKEFLLNMNNLHLQLTREMDNANPPQFDIKKGEADSIIMTYKSDRSLFELFKSLIKGVGEYFDEKLEIKATADNKVEVKFL